MDFRKTVKKQMKEKNINVSELAKKTGYTTRHIYDLLADKNGARWNETTFTKIFAILGLELSVKPIEQRTGTDN